MPANAIGLLGTPARTRGRYRRLLRDFTAAIAAFLLVACVGTNRGDPGNRRLHAIRSDRGFRLVVDGTQLSREDELSAKKVTFTTSYFGPSATRTLAVTAVPSEVLGTYDQRVRELGWQPAGTTPFMTYDSRTYRKSFGSWEATLTVSMYPDDQHKLVIEVSAPPVPAS